jgi:hypothetical protein
LTKENYKKLIGLRPARKRHGNVIWLKTSTFRELFPDDPDGIAKQLASEGVLSPNGKAHLTRQQRVPGLDVKEYFYVIDRARLTSPMPIYRRSKRTNA